MNFPTPSRRALLSCGAAMLACGSASAQSPIGGTITLYVPFTPGTGIDMCARLIGEELKQRWQQSVIVENRPGVSGNLGTMHAASQPPDGHALMVTANTFVMNASLFKSLPYDPHKSFAPIVLIATGSLALVVGKGFPARTVDEFVVHARSNPSKVNYATPGRGTPQHLAMELFAQTAGIALNHVPYSGSAGAVRDLLSGHVDAMFMPLHTALPLVVAKQLVILAIGSEKRSPLALEVPTLLESNVKDFAVDLWYALLSPSGMTRALVLRFNAEINAILQSSEVARALATQGLTPAGGPPDRLADLMAKDQVRWSEVVKRAGITAE